MGNYIASDGAAVPVGTIVAHGAALGGNGFLECNGAVISRALFADLFSVLGVIWGAGDGVTTFSVPDLRGEFVRGFDNGAGVDAGRLFASTQLDDNKAHSHSVSNRSNTANGAAAFPAIGSAAYGAGSISLINSGGVEARPRNVAVGYWVKF